MVIKETFYHYGDLYYEGSISINLKTNDGTKTVSFGKGEPEDNCLARDLNDAFRIADMLEMAYNAGRNNEKLEIYSESDKED